MIGRLIQVRSIGLGLFAFCACGVVEHPHELQAIDTSGDFGPIGGTGVVSTGGAATLPNAGSPTGGATGGTPTGTTAGTAPSGGAPAASGAGGVPASAGSGGSGSAGAPVLSGVTINLGGVEVPKEKAIAFIHIGHSNMFGKATSPTASRPYHFTETNPRAWMYHPGSSPALALEPKTAGSGNTAGPGTALMKSAADLAKPDYYFISLGFGQESAYCSQFLPSGLYYDKLIAGPKAIKGRVTFGGIFIYLGITERHGSAADRTGFANCINSLVTAIRTDVGEPNMPLLMNDYEVEGSGEFVVGGDVYNAIKPQIDKIPTTVANSALVSCAGLAMQDDHHFNLDGHKTWVGRALMTMQQKGWFPWAK
jgi:Carbohydrate esterase, sialic acid-specific acetylesterase